MVQYTGFNTVEVLRPPYKLYDIDLVKRDIMNQFDTKMGERVMMPNFGSRIHEVLYDPLDDITRDIIQSDVTRIILSEPRVLMIGSPEISEYGQGIEVRVSLQFLPDKTIDDLLITFERDFTDGV